MRRLRGWHIYNQIYAIVSLEYNYSTVTGMGGVKNFACVWNIWHNDLFMRKTNLPLVESRTVCMVSNFLFESFIFCKYYKQKSQVS